MRPRLNKDGSGSSRPLAWLVAVKRSVILLAVGCVQFIIRPMQPRWMTQPDARVGHRKHVAR